MVSLRNWFGHPANAPPQFSAVVETAGPLASSPEPPTESSLVWPSERLAVTDALWGRGHQLPGGEPEIVRLAKPLGLSAACSLLLIGAGSGGPPVAVAEKLGVWVTGFETDQVLVDAGTDLLRHSKFGKRAQIELWDPGIPHFQEHFFHHGMALEPLRDHQPEPILAAIAAALKPGGQLTMLEIVADEPLTEENPVVRRWAELEHRIPESLPTERNVTRVLGRLGFDVRLAEDLSQRQIQQALIGWRRLVRALESRDEKPGMKEAAALVAEAELWLLRLRMFQSGQLRLIRWHGIGRGG
jgi:SAM-dependent methyltransferase